MENLGCFEKFSKLIKLDDQLGLDFKEKYL